jgi:hypothetical protein
MRVSRVLQLRKVIKIAPFQPEGAILHAQVRVRHRSTIGASLGRRDLESCAWRWA